MLGKFKTFSACLLILVLCLSGCKPGNNQPTASGLETAEPTMGQNTEIELNPQTDCYNNGYTSNMIVGVDQYGRATGAVPATRTKREVGVFSTLWLGQPTLFDEIYDATKILAMENGLKLLFDPAYLDNSIAPADQPYFWGEPIWGYYNAADDWVIRRQIELLTAADVDFIMFDITNIVTYEKVYTKVMKVVSEFIEEGWDAPKICFYTHSRSIQVMNEMYKNVYKKNLYPKSWYCIDNKPLIIGYTDPAKDKQEAFTRKDYEYNPDPLSDEVTNFFTFKQPHWPGEKAQEDTFPWMEWIYPQQKHGEVMSVTAAAHPHPPFSFSLTENAINWGRGWNPATHKNDSVNAGQGGFFQAEWDTVMTEDPEIVTICNWSGWISYKSMYLGQYMLCDSLNEEYSCEIEPMKGGHTDAFYQQLIRNIKAYKTKGVTAEYTKAVTKTIDINGSAEQWNDINAVYRDIGMKNYNRKSVGAAKTISYKAEEARNNIQEVRVTDDQDSIYFMIRSDKDITPYDGSQNWMNLFIGTGEPSQKGWEGYEYVINRQFSSQTCSIEKLSADFTSTTEGEALVNIQGEVMQIKIPRSALGLSGNDNRLYFKVADAVANPGDITDYYVSGKSLPLGRMSFMYMG